MGRLQRGQLGRPAFISSLARSTKAAAWPRVMRKRAIAGWVPLSSVVASSAPSSASSCSSLASTNALSCPSSQPPARAPRRPALAAGQEAREVLAQCAHVLLLDLQGDQAAALPRLQVEHALAGRADGAGSEVIGRIDLERGVGAHALLSPSQARSPVRELTVRTAGPPRRELTTSMDVALIRMA